MSSLQFSERNLLEKILGMRTGYVSDFSDRTFQEFVLEKTGIDILTPEYEENGTSKANRLRTFLKKESDATVIALIEPLINYAYTEKTGFDREIHARDEILFIEARKIVQRLKDDLSTSFPQNAELTVTDVSSRPKAVSGGMRPVFIPQTKSTSRNIDWTKWGTIFAGIGVLITLLALFLN